MTTFSSTRGSIGILYYVFSKLQRLPTLHCSQPSNFVFSFILLLIHRRNGSFSISLLYCLRLLARDSPILDILSVLYVKEVVKIKGAVFHVYGRAAHSCCSFLQRTSAWIQGTGRQRELSELKLVVAQLDSIKHHSLPQIISNIWRSCLRSVRFGHLLYLIPLIQGWSASL